MIKKVKLKNVQIKPSTHNLVKTYCVSHGITMYEFCDNALLDAIGYKRTNKQVTLKWDCADKK